MTWIQTVPEPEATGRLKQIYDGAVQRAGRVFGILRVMSQSPGTLAASMGFYQAVMLAASPLTRKQRELMAVVTSKTNDCHY